ncbi:hypothetical protein PI124_g15658 [Phytophthora idaei]|nr:hypothetical protein PI125_g16283 [Phytophthora idaei]KAG3141914.1 hypothetical protein PI126_g15281 [Phytophthora idaei]KAG3239406.1 hypothetical protein PI124_g15658 [Phytophthora idaei]
MNDPMAALMPTHREENQLKELFEELKTFESSTKKLQNADGLSLLDVRDIFDALISEHPGVKNYLGQMMRSSSSLSSKTPAWRSWPERLTALLLPFAAPATTPPELEDKALGFADRALKKHKLQCETPSEYPEIAAIPPT